MISCCLAFQTENSDYYRHVYVCMLSCIKNTSSPVHFHLVADGLTQEARERFQTLCSHDGHALTFYEPPVIPAPLQDGIPPQFGVGCLYLCCLHEVLPVEKVVYVDGDVIFERDIADLAAVDLAGKSAAAVIDVNLQRHKKDFAEYFRQIGANPANYVNSGVLLLDLERIRHLSLDENIFWKAFAAMRKRWPEGALRFPDQDLLNLALADDEIRLLDESFNWLVSFQKRRFASARDGQGKILHFAGAKPWNSLCPAYLSYWKYAVQSPWGGDAAQKMIDLLASPDMDLAWYSLAHARSVERLRRLMSLFR